MGMPQSHYFPSGCLQLHYVDWGNPTAPPLLLVHGGLDHCRNWDWVAEALQDRYHVMALDLRGHGDSDWGGDNGYNLTDHVFDLHQWINHLQLEQVTLIGHSLGGAIVLRYAGIYPKCIQQLVAIEGLGPSPTLIKEQEARSSAERLREWIRHTEQNNQRPAQGFNSLEAATERMQTKNAHLSPERALHLSQHGCRQREDGHWYWKFDPRVRVHSSFNLSNEQVRELWRNINCPTLLVRGNDSWASNPTEDGRAAYFNDAQVCNIDDAGHWVHHDQFGVFMETLESFLQTP